MKKGFPQGIKIVIKPQLLAQYCIAKSTVQKKALRNPNTHKN